MGTHRHLLEEPTVPSLKTTNKNNPRPLSWGDATRGLGNSLFIALDPAGPLAPTVATLCPLHVQLLIAEAIGSHCKKMVQIPPQSQDPPQHLRPAPPALWLTPPCDWDPESLWSHTFGGGHIQPEHAHPIQTLDSGFSGVPSPPPSQTHRGPTGLGTAGPGFCSGLRSSGPKGWQETKRSDALSGRSGHGESPTPSYLLVIAVVAVQFVEVGGTLQREGLDEQSSPRPER